MSSEHTESLNNEHADGLGHSHKDEIVIPTESSACNQARHNPEADDKKCDEDQHTIDDKVSLHDGLDGEGDILQSHDIMCFLLHCQRTP